MKTTFAKIALLTSSMAFAASAHAATSFINMQIDGAPGPLSGTYGTGTGQYLAPVAYTGSTWNQASLSATDMVNSDGVATTIDFTLDIVGKSLGGSGPTDNPWMEALNGYRYKNVNASNPATILFSGLTSGDSYDIHFILQGNLNEGGLVTMTSGFSGTGPAPSESLGTEGRSTNQGGPATAYILGENFVTQSFISDGTDAVFTIDRNSGTSFIAVAGFQIAVIPEPSTALLGGFVLLLALVRRRR